MPKQILLFLFSLFCSKLVLALPFSNSDFAAYLDSGFCQINKISTPNYSSIALDAALKQWYQQANYYPFWVNSNGAESSATKLAELIKISAEDGLNPNDYFYQAINKRINQNSKQSLVELEVLLTLAATTLASDARYGRLNLRQLDLAQFQNDALDKPDLVGLGLQILTSKDPVLAISAQFPQHRQYRRMKDALNSLRQIAVKDGWPKLPGKVPLIPGKVDPRILILRNILKITGDLAESEPESALFDSNLSVAVKTFQERHGINPTGEVHELTLKALNVPVEERIQTLMINLERWRWLERDFTQDKEIYVNIAGYELFGLEGSKIALRLPVIVGKNFHATPIYSSAIKHIELNPYWNVPSSIAANEMLPKLRKNPGYLSKEHMQIYRVGGKSSLEISASDIDWQQVKPSQMGRYAIKQIPGPWNALGEFKFVFPNPYSVYLHDTSNRNLFTQRDRALSHGCIRVNRPDELALFLLDSDSDRWNLNRLEDYLADGQNKIIKLPQPVPVHLTYRTAWVDLDNSINFREDIYKRDKILAATSLVK